MMGIVFDVFAVVAIMCRVHVNFVAVPSNPVLSIPKKYSDTPPAEIAMMFTFCVKSTATHILVFTAYFHRVWTTNGLITTSYVRVQMENPE